MLSTAHPVLTDRYVAAIEWAAAIHRFQVRHNTNTPYLSHLLETSGFVIEEGAEEDVAIAALLHDSIEDQPITPEMIAQRFGDRVAQIVEDCTDASKAERETTPWKEIKLRHLERIPRAPDESLLVICADKVSSLRALIDDLIRFGYGLFASSENTAEELLWHYEQVEQILAKRLGALPMTTRLSELVGRFKASVC